VGGVVDENEWKQLEVEGVQQKALNDFTEEEPL
jgi:hypothetical protein